MTTPDPMPPLPSEDNLGRIIYDAWGPKGMDSMGRLPPF